MRAGNYVVVFDPLDGSSNIDAGISTGSIFGIYAPSEECSVDDMDDPEKMMQVQGHTLFVLYVSSRSFQHGALGLHAASCAGGP